jgi:NDP-sugar pyrophosphorylase family protein
MLLDADLGALVRHHREREAAATLLLLDDPRAAEFGSIGVDAEGCLRRIGARFDLHGEVRSGLYTWANVFAARIFDAFPEREVFSHLDDWLTPLLASGSRDILGKVAEPRECAWTPVGTLGEYLNANFEAPHLSYFDADAAALRLGVQTRENVVLGAGATLDAGASLDRVVVWSGESVGPLNARNGVFAGGSFHSCAPCETTDARLVSSSGAGQDSTEVGGE